MLLTVIRDEIKKDYTGGVLLVDGKEFSRTIEPPYGYASGPVTSHPPKYGVPKAQQSRSYPCGKELRSNGESGDLEGFNKGRAFSPRPKESNAKGCIPMGWYKIQVTYSPKFKRQMPLLYMVPGFEGIRIHAGLSVKNTNGCICVGERWREDKLTSILIKAQERNEEIFICITDKDRASSELSVGYKPDET